MAVLRSFRVTFEVVKESAGVGAKYLYRRGINQITVAAASAAAVAGVVAGDLTLGTNEVVEIIDIHEDPGGLLT
jgi:hypothetical protein